MVDLARLAPGPIGPLAGMEYVRQRGMEGQQRGQQNALSRLAGQAYNAPQADRQAIFGQMAQVDPAAAMKTEQAFQQRDTDARTELSNQARLFVNLIDKSPDLAQQVYTGLAQTAQRAGFNVPPAYDPSFLEGIKTIAAQGVEGPEQFTLAPGSKRFDAAGNVIAEVDPSPVNAQVVAVPDGQGGTMQMVFDPRTRQLTMPQYNAPSAPQMEATGGPGMFAGLLSSVPGLRVTSTTRTPDQNKAAGGVDNSYHLSGQAIDIGTPSPEQRAAISQWASANGFEVIDNYKDGHVHLEPAPGRGAPQGGARLGYTPPKAQGEQYTTMSPQEVAALGLPSGTIAQRSPSGQVQIINKPRDLPTGGQVIDNGDGTTTYIPAGKVSEGERNAAGFFQRMEAANAEMDRIISAGYDPTNRRDFYTAGGEFLNPLASSEGQQYRQAQENWVRANLRKESGAAIGVAEMDQERKNYFPIPGDSPEVIRQKARNREVTERAMRAAAGGALAPPQSAAPREQASTGILRYNPATGDFE